MSNQFTIYSNTITALLSHRVTDVVLSVETGHLNIIIGEHLYLFSPGSNISIPKGTAYAYANLSLSPAIVTERIDNPTFAKDIVTHADVNGVIYDVNSSPSLQISHSLYLGLVDMLLPNSERLVA